MRFDRSLSSVLVVMFTLTLVLFWLPRITGTLVGLNVVLAGAIGGYVGASVFKALVGATAVTVVLILPLTLFVSTAGPLDTVLLGFAENTAAIFVTALCGATAGDLG